MEAEVQNADSPRAGAGIFALAMVLCALAVSLANNLDLYSHIGLAVCGSSLALAFCAAAVSLPSLRNLKFGPRELTLVMGLAVVVQAWLTPTESAASRFLSAGFVTVVLLELLQLLESPRRRMVILAILAAGFFAACATTIAQPNRFAADVLVSQQEACEFLSHGVNPYTARYPNIYSPHTPLYAPGMVDSTNHLTFGFGYPPLNLLLDLPSYWLSGDVRYGLAAALVLSAILIAAAGGRRLNILAAAVLLSAPQWLRMLTIGWNEPLLILTFSFLMFCACRWRRGLPWALGLFLCTKQYAIVIVPLLPLLDFGRAKNEKWPAITKTLLVIAAVNLPFLLRGPSAFWRSLITAHWMQAFRPDSLSYTAWLYRITGGWILPEWTCLAAVVFVWIESLRRAPRSPSGFAAAVTWTLLVFFLFNKQAFCNYYYFLMATAWWSVASARVPISRNAADMAFAHPASFQATVVHPVQL